MVIQNRNMKTIKIEIDNYVSQAQEVIDEKKDLLTYEEFLNNYYSVDSKTNKYKGIGIVYFIYVFEEGSFKIRYIGKSKGLYFKNRIVNHFDHKNERTNSKMTKIQAIENFRENVKINFIFIEPESMRSAIEEELITIYSKELWNKQVGKK